MAEKLQYDFTSESVSEGHPDKVCDKISDAILDELIRIDHQARVGCEVFATTNQVVVGGEVGLKNTMKIEDLSELVIETVRSTVKNIGYEQKGFHWNDLKILNLLHQQSPDIAQGVDREGAGDQGIMFGYAVNETPELMPAPLQYSQAILKRLSIARKNELKDKLGPDSKSQLTVNYINGIPHSIKSIVVSIQHFDEQLTSENIKEIITPYILETLPDGWITENTIWHVNPTGKFVIGGPDGDAGLTGRKIIVDTYGGSAQHGGGAFSGKDPTKVDRSAAYMTRYLAKNVVASDLASKCSIQIAYAIGVSEPLSLYVNTFGTGKVDDQVIEKCIKKIVDLSPRGIRNKLKLNNPIYVPTSAYGHFGRKPDELIKGSFTWEKTDLVEMLKKEL